MEHTVCRYLQYKGITWKTFPPCFMFDSIKSGSSKTTPSGSVHDWTLSFRYQLMFSSITVNSTNIWWSTSQRPDPLARFELCLFKVPETHENTGKKAHLICFLTSDLFLWCFSFQIFTITSRSIKGHVRGVVLWKHYEWLITLLNYVTYLL